MAASKIRVIEKTLPILLLPDFITPFEAAHLVLLAQERFKRSRVVCDDPKGCVDDVRTSETSYLDEDEITRAVQARARIMSGYDRVEPLQAVKYGPGQEYKPHLDAFDRDTPEGVRSICNSKGRRAATLLVYLNEPRSGGETVFPELGIAVKPQANAAIFWKNLLIDGSPNPRSRHGGAPVGAGVKYALNVWLIEPEPAVSC
jgi:prolyl 4-hydroxylase